MHATKTLSRNGSTLAKKSTTTSKTIKYKSKIPMLKLDDICPLKLSILAPATTTCALNSTRRSGKFTFDINKENHPHNEQPSSHLFDTLSKLEVQNKVKANILEDTVLRLLEKEGELWQIKNKSAPTHTYEGDCIMYDSPYNKSKYRQSIK
jgi:hypothetical protein